VKSDQIESENYVLILDECLSKITRKKESVIRGLVEKIEENRNCSSLAKRVLSVLLSIFKEVWSIVIYNMRMRECGCQQNYIHEKKNTWIYGLCFLNGGEYSCGEIYSFLERE
jgi:hypothetical protein